MTTSTYVILFHICFRWQKSNILVHNMLYSCDAVWVLSKYWQCGEHPKHSGADSNAEKHLECGSRTASETRFLLVLPELPCTSTGIPKGMDKKTASEVQLSYSPADPIRIKLIPSKYLVKDWIYIVLTSV